MTFDAMLATIRLRGRSSMALDARKRQQKLAKKAAKRKAVVATKKSLGRWVVWCPMGGNVPVASALSMNA
jgi:hypothetical protein